MNALSLRCYFNDKSDSEIVMMLGARYTSPALTAMSPLDRYLVEKELLYQAQRRQAYVLQVAQSN